MVGGYGSYSRYPGGPLIMWNGCPGDYFQAQCATNYAKRDDASDANDTSATLCPIPSNTASFINEATVSLLGVVSLNTAGSVTGTGTITTSSAASPQAFLSSDSTSTNTSKSASSSNNPSSSTSSPSGPRITPSQPTSTSTTAPLSLLSSVMTASTASSNLLSNVLATSTSPPPATGTYNCNEDGCTPESPACCGDGSCTNAPSITPSPATSTCTYL